VKLARIIPAAVMAAPIIACGAPQLDQKPLVTDKDELKVSVFRDGSIRIDNQLVRLSDIDGYLATASSEQKVIWYYREGPDQQPTDQQMEAFEAIIDAGGRYRMPLRLFATSDFSESIDD
jgi:hypothetical protein